ncbi:redoxin domain-containing protein [Flavobacterium sp. MK4S-17]|uniref:TlpA family protein disulfide reductase n=1 Tax=Flavobacterium sp. MK4S-17 TaxID=2543737 RepID=UPI0013569FE4|nr:redoxin domain-containing protein [Flavobacterium sp. MK4S-17]
MNKLLVAISLYLFPLLLFSQGDSLYFSNAVRINLKKYKKESSLAFRTGNVERGKYLFDSLVDYRLTGTKMDNFTFKKVNRKKIKLNSFKKPVVLITYASWCVMSPGEIPALNKIAQKYKDDVAIVVLFWDRRNKMKRLARKFNRHITVCYAHESYKGDSNAVTSLKHTLGLPTSFYLDSKLHIVDIKRCGMQLCPKKTPYNKAYALNYNSFLEGLSTIIIDKEVKKDMLAIK